MHSDNRNTLRLKETREQSQQEVTETLTSCQVCFHITSLPYVNQMSTPDCYQDMMLNKVIYVQYNHTTGTE